MAFELSKPVTTTDLVSEFNLDLVGVIRSIQFISNRDEDVNDSIIFTKSDVPESEKSKVIIAPRPMDHKNSTFIIHNNPRLMFAKIVNWILENHSEVKAGSTCIDPSVKMGINCFVGKDVKIGKGTVIGSNVVISSKTIIGENCIIKSNTVIGENGFGFERDLDGTPIRFPHLGGVIIGNNVELGSLNTVVRGALGDTVIEDFVKTDDHVHIAHNCYIETGVLITACVELSGGVRIGKNAWIGPNSSLMQKITIGESSTVGLGTVVLRNVDANTVVAGVPARVLGVN